MRAGGVGRVDETSGRSTVEGSGARPAAGPTRCWSGPVVVAACWWSSRGADLFGRGVQLAPATADRGGSLVVVGPGARPVGGRARVLVTWLWCAAAAGGRVVVSIRRRIERGADPVEVDCDARDHWLLAVVPGLRGREVPRLGVAEREVRRAWGGGRVEWRPSGGGRLGGRLGWWSSGVADLGIADLGWPTWAAVEWGGRLGVAEWRSRWSGVVADLRSRGLVRSARVASRGQGVNGPA